MNKKFLKILVITMLMILTVLLIYIFAFPSNEYYKKYSDWRQTFGIITYETLRGDIMTESENEEYEDIYTNICFALESIGLDESEITYPYNSLYVKRDGVAYVEYTATPIKFTCVFDKGYYWLEFTVRRYSENGELLHYAKDVLICVECELKDGEWNGKSIKRT